MVSGKAGGGAARATPKARRVSMWRTDTAYVVKVPRVDPRTGTAEEGCRRGCGGSRRLGAGGGLLGVPCGLRDEAMHGERCEQSQIE